MQLKKVKDIIDRKSGTDSVKSFNSARANSGQLEEA